MGVAISTARIKGRNVDSSGINGDVELSDTEKQLQPKQGIAESASVPVTTATTTSAFIDDITTSRVTTGTSNFGVNGDGTAVDSGSQSRVSAEDEASISSSNHTFTTCTSTTDNNNNNNRNSGTGPYEEPDEETGYQMTNVNDDVGEKETKANVTDAINEVKAAVVRAFPLDKQAQADTAVSTPQLQLDGAPSGEMGAGVWQVRYTTPRPLRSPSPEAEEEKNDDPEEPLQLPETPTLAQEEPASAYPVTDDDRVPLPEAQIAIVEPRQPRRWLWPAAMIVVLVVGMLVALLVGVFTREHPAIAVDVNDGPPQPNILRPNDKDYVRHLLPNYTIATMELDKSSPQALAFDWVVSDPHLDIYHDWRILQRFALATFYYATSGESWVSKKGWLDHEVHECDWHDFSYKALLALRDLIFDVYSYDIEQVTNVPGTSLESLKHYSPCGEESEVSQGIYRHVWQSNNLLKGTVPPELFLLTNLRSLLLAMSDIDGTIPSQVGQLTNLQQLVTWNLDLKGTIPTEIGMLSNLFMLLHYGSFLSGAIPSEIQHLTNLEIMSVTENQLTSIPESFGLLSGLKDLDLGRNKLSRLPTELGQLTALTALGLYSNELQDFPSAIFSLTALESLGMWSNPLNASIPTDIGLLTDLKHLFLYDTSLTGSLPSEVGLLSSLEYLRVGDNHLAGEIPEELFKLAMSGTMVNLNVTGNILLEGTIPGGVCDDVVFLFNCTSRLCGCACKCPALNGTT